MTKKEFTEKMDQLLKPIRKEYGYTQDKMAAALGLSKKTLVDIEKGRRTLGWTGAAALAAICGTSRILQEAFGGDPADLVTALAFADAAPRYPQTMGGKIWWREIVQKDGFRIQQNILSGHYRLLDAENRRVMASFERKQAEKCLVDLLPD